MNVFDYASEAGLLVSDGAEQSQTPRRFIPFLLAADAIRFAVEALPDGHPEIAGLETKTRTFDSAGIRRLYESTAYPLKRQRPIDLSS